MSNDIYDIIRRLDESLNPQQRSVPQLPALFKPKSISVLGAKTDPEHPMKGYAVGTSESAEEPTAEAEIIPIRQGGVKFVNKKDYLDKRDVIFRILSQPGLDPETKEELKTRLSDFEQAAKAQGLITESDETNPMRQAVMHRIVNQNPEWITRYGAEALVQAIDDVTEGDTDWEEIGSSDVSAYVNMVHNRLRDHAGSREEIDEIEMPQTAATQQSTSPTGQIDKNKYNQLAQQVNQARRSNQMDRVKELTGQLAGITGDQGIEIDIKGDIKPMAEAAEPATEDVISAVKRKLGDYLQDVATAIQKDPDLKDKIPQDIDQVKAVKTIRTDDGHEIKIHGNEDDGFRISIRNQDIKRPFRSLDEATMACEMYCAKRRHDMLNADYVEER